MSKSARKVKDPTELVLLRSESIEGNKLLVVDPFDASSLIRLSQSRPDDLITALCRDYRVFRAARRIESDRLRAVFDLFPDNFDCDSALVYMPKGKELLSLTLEWLGSRMPEGAPLYLTGDKHSGVSSFPKLLSPLFDMPRKIDSARHCLLFEARKIGRPGEYDLAGRVAWIEADPADCRLHVAQLPGVFSFGELDEGSVALSQAMQLDEPSSVLDVGCGCGLLGGLIAKRFPGCDVTMTDVNAAAICATGMTIARNRLGNARCLPSDLYTEIEGRFDIIVTNPPFHTGHEVDRTVTERLIRGAARHLNPEGCLQIVGNRFLPYRELLGKQFDYVKTLAEDNRYTVCLARDPREARSL